MSTNDPSDTADREIVVERLLDAPRELVFKTYTDPDHLGHWWGPDGFTLTIQSIDIRPGGMWKFIMHGPDGKDYPNVVHYIEVDRPARLVYTHGDETDKAMFTTTVTFEDRGGKTFLRMRALFPTAEAREFVVKNFNAVEGGKQTVGRLDAYLKTLQPGK